MRYVEHLKLEIKSRMTVPRGQRERSMGNYCLITVTSQLNRGKEFWKCMVVIVA